MVHEVIESSQASLPLFSSNRLPCDEVSFGRVTTKGASSSFSVFYVLQGDARPSIEFNTEKFSEIKISFHHGAIKGQASVWALCLYVSEIDGLIEMDESQEETVMIIHAKGAFRILQRKTSAKNPDNDDGAICHGKDRVSWSRRNEIPQTGFEEDATEGPMKLLSTNALWEVGRCNTVYVRLSSGANQGPRFSNIVKRLQSVNVRFEKKAALSYHFDNIGPAGYRRLWQHYYANSKALPFRSLYLLESAVSLDKIEETDIARVMHHLSGMAPSMAAERILEQIALGDKMTLDPATHIKNMFDRKGWLSLAADKIPEYCVLLQKVVITSTSMVILPSTMEMSNRILRQYSAHLNRFMRVQFLDDIKRGRLHGQSPALSSLFKRVMRTLVEGVYVGGRLYRFLAFGNSQLREHGVFFFSDCTGFKDCGVPGCQGLTARRIREDIGDVSEILIVAKQAARVGQAFSTTRALRKHDISHNIIMIPDQIGGTNREYSFTDGVGLITSDLLKEVSRSMGRVANIPSAFQFRLGGAKGVLCAISPAGLHGSFKGHVLRSQQIFLRKSQTKFQSDHDSLEVVRLALYGSAFLNRQFITTLWTLGVDSQVFLDLQRCMIKDLDDCMLDEEVALRCLRRHVDETGASSILGDLVSFGFLRRGETFVNQVLRLFRTWSLKQLKEKAKISIEKGCYLMGVADEVGVLRGHHESMYHQDDSDLSSMDLPEIFVQISDPDDKSRLKIIEGICIVTRAPALHPGDLRVVRAVDKPELRYLHDVLVMPSEGDQDVASMCGGGDLDGDDYTIIWEPSLIPSKGRRYVRCMNYAGPKPKVVAKITLRDVFEFVIDFMKNDSLGQIAYAHLAFAHDAVATLHGRKKVKDCRAFSDECMKLAELHSTAVDFGKTGVPAMMPESLSRKSYPDFMEVPKKESYVSDTPLSHLYRQVKTSSSVYEPSINYDKTLCEVPNMLEHLDAARDMKKSYDNAIRRLMAQYGIGTEAEVVTGFILGFDSRFSGQKEFSMRTDVAHKFAAIKDSIRKQIAELSSTDEQGRPLDRYLAECTRESFVAAMYDVTFTETLQQEKPENALISFPWIEHEVLGRLSTRRSQKLKYENNV